MIISRFHHVIVYFKKGVQIADKYGVKAQGGDKVAGRMVDISDTHLTVIGTAIGYTEDKKEISVPLEDVRMVCLANDGDPKWENMYYYLDITEDTPYKGKFINWEDYR